MDEIGKIGKYQIVRVLGEGGMGRVYEATDPIIGRRVAVKVISLGVDTPDSRARFFREAQAAGCLSHSNIITIYDIGGEPDQAPYIVMEYLDGTDLSRQLAGGLLSIEKKIQIAVDICEGLAHAHENGIIHRDIKPANIFITAQGHAKIVDFGLARGEASDLTHTGTILGTPNYMSPEQILGQSVDQRSDIFAVGVMLYELFSGQKPFAGDTVAATIYKVLQTEPPPIHTVDAALPPALSSVIQKAIAKDRNARFQSVRELRDELVAMWMGRRTEPVDLTAFTGVIPPGSAQAAIAAATSTRRTMWMAGGGAAALAVIVGASLTVAGLRRQPDSRAASPAAASATTASSSSTAAPQTASATEARPAPTSPAADTTPAATTQPPADAPRADGARTEPPRVDPPKNDRPRDDKSRTIAKAAPSPAPPSAPAAAAASAPAPAPTVVAREQAQPPAPAVAQAPAVTPQPVEPKPDIRRQAAEAAPGAVPPSPPAVPAARPDPERSKEANAAGIQRLVAEYRGALESRDLGALRRIWPTLSGRQEDAIRSEFDHTRSIKVDFTDIQTSIEGSEATVSCRRRYAITTADGQRLDTSSKMTMTLSGREGNWTIDNIRFEARQ